MANEGVEMIQRAAEAADEIRYEFVYIYIYIFIYTSKYIYVYIHIHAYIYIHIYICIYMYVYKYNHEIRYELRQQNLKRVEGHGNDNASGVCILDDTPNVTNMKNKKFPSTEFSEHRKWLIDPLRLTVRFPGRSSLRVDDKMCEGMYIRCMYDTRMFICIYIYIYL
jgi:Ca2+/Na+ antiporter